MPAAIRLWGSLAVALIGAALVVASAFAQQDGGTARSIELNGTIDPATEEWLSQALDDAADDGVELAIIRIDTPGGLDSSTRSMVKDIIAAPMPVVAYVSPDGARAASAGVFITQASDVAAMSPQTNIGSATPISLGPGGDDEVLGRKVTNDAAAYARALAEGHGRNGELAGRLVTEAENVTAGEAREQNLIDLVAANEEELLSALDGFRVRGPKAQTLSTEGLVIDREDMPLQYDLLQLIVNPTIAFLLLGIGVLGLAIEILNPGLIAPGATGLLALILGLYGTAQIPIRLTGVLLLVLAVGLLIAEAHIAAGGVLGVMGIAALIGSGLLLYDTDSEAFEISEPTVILTALVVGALLVFVIKKVTTAHREPVLTGWEEMVGRTGEVRVPLDPVGQIWSEGALWRARPAADGTEIGLGNRVRVDSVDGLTLVVRPLEEQPEPDREGS